MASVFIGYTHIIQGDSNMEKAVIIGGSNGIGAAIAKLLCEDGYSIIIVDKCPPDKSIFEHINNYRYIYCDLLNIKESIFEELTADNDIKVLMLTAGFGRVAEFEWLSPVEMDNTIQVNTIANLKIIRYFYEKIKSPHPFYCGIMGSIAGWISSPMFSVYAASKAAICRFVESVNIELEQSGYQNRILNVSPGSISGSKFNGGENQLSLLENLAREIVSRLKKSDTLYIPEYDTVYKDVLKRYHADPHAFGMTSFQYKKESGRVFNEKKLVIGYLSGTFDLFHIGHLNLLRNAKKYCDYLIVGVHPSAAHKGKEAFIPLEERMQIVEACKYVNKVVPSCPEDSDAWELWHYHKLFVGSDYKGTERFNRYEEYFKDKDVEIVYFPYTKGTSSTQIRNVLLQQQL